MKARLRSRFRGQGLVEVAVVCGIMGSLGGGGMGAAWQALGTAHRVETTMYMKQIFMALTMWADDNDGRLPDADLYPDIRRDPNAVKTSPRSIARILGLDLPWVSSRAPETFRRAGLTYIWNSSLNGKLVDQIDANTWVLMDMNAAGWSVPDQIPRADGYLVLWGDGHVKYEHVPPKVIPDNQADALKQRMGQGGGGGAEAADGGGGGGGGGGAQGGGQADAVVPDDPDKDMREKEESARRSNPDEDDAVDE